MTSNPKRLVEEQLPLSEANLNASLKMAFRGMAAKLKDEFSEIYGIQPKKIGVGTTLLRNLHPWPARRPTAPARLLTLASVLPNNFDREHFREISGLLQIPELAKQVYSSANRYGRMGIGEFPGYRDIREITVEHILPQNPAGNSG
jgi:hypothetical protein